MNKEFQLRTDMLEFYIALVRHRETSAETVLRQVADQIGAPIRESAINEQYEKLEASAKRRAQIIESQTKRGQRFRSADL